MIVAACDCMKIRGLMPQFLFILFIFLPAVGFAQINKCLVDGQLLYTDKVCPENTSKNFKFNKLNISSGEDSSSTSNGVYRSTQWYTDATGYQRALKISASKKAPIFIYGYTDWCVYCKKLKKGLFADRDVKKLLEHFVKVKINPEHSLKDERLFKRWGGRCYPTLFVQHGENQQPQRTQGPFYKKKNQWKMRSKEAFISMLKQQLDYYQKL